MPNVEVQKVTGNEKATFPLFHEIAKKFDAVRNRAFQLFEGRGCQTGHDFDDWLQAERELMGAPAAELTDKGNAYEAQIALPGFDPKDVEVTATPDEIVVHAASKKEKTSESGQILWSEFFSNEVFRRIPAPAPLNTNNTTAVLEQGILRINAPKAVQPKPMA